MIHYKAGDAIDALESGKIEVLAHQVNCRGVMGAGIALSIREKFPNVFERYSNFLKFQEDYSRRAFLGECFMVETDSSLTKWVANCFGQNDYGGTKRDTNYEAFSICMENLHSAMYSKNLTKVGMPWKIGCGLAKGNWDVIQSIIAAEFGGSKTIEVSFYKL